MSQNTHAGLMKEVKAFNTADANWRKLMKRARENNLAKYWADDYVVIDIRFKRGEEGF